MNPNSKMVNTIIYRMLNEELKNKIDNFYEKENIDEMDKYREY